MVINVSVFIFCGCQLELIRGIMLYIYRMCIDAYVYDNVFCLYILI